MLSPIRKIIGLPFFILKMCMPGPIVLKCVTLAREISPL